MQWRFNTSGKIASLDSKLFEKKDFVKVISHIEFNSNIYKHINFNSTFLHTVVHTDLPSSEWRCFCHSEVNATLIQPRHTSMVINQTWHSLNREINYLHFKPKYLEEEGKNTDT